MIYPKRTKQYSRKILKLIITKKNRTRKTTNKRKTMFNMYVLLSFNFVWVLPKNLL